MAGASSPQGTGRERAHGTFRPDIEGLRAVAVGLVVLDHAGVAALNGGYVGVDVFFVLSGFLITGLLIKELETTGRISLGNFYARRFRRLLPAGTLVLLATVLASARALGGSRAERIAEDARWATLFAANLRFIDQGTDYFGAQLPPSPLQHYWSLAVEEQFYAVWPALILAVAMVGRRVPLRLKLCAVLALLLPASLLWSVRQTAVDGTAAYFSPLTRAWELGVGALLAAGATRLRSVPRPAGGVATWVGLAAITAAALRFDAGTAFPGTAALLPVLGAALAVAGGTAAPGGGAERFLALPPFQWLGRLSYSLYLWHWPVLVVVAGWAGRKLAVWENLMLCTAAVGLSAATFHLIETPVREADGLKRRPPRDSLALGSGLLAVSLLAIAWAGQRGPQAEEVQTAAAQTELPSANAVLAAVASSVGTAEWPAQPPRIANPAYSKACNVTRRDTRSAACVHGDPAADRTVVVYGDSHAAMWIPALDRIGKREGWRVVQLTKPACQVADFPSYSQALNRAYTECSAFREFALGQIAALRPDVVILSSAYKGTLLAKNGKPTTDGIEEAWAAGLGSVIDRIAPTAGRIVVLGDMAYPAEPGIDCLTAHPGNAGACDTPRSRAVYADHNAMEARVAAAHGASYVDVIPWFCTAETCPAVIGGLTVHRDAYHVAENYAVWLSIPLAASTGLMSGGAVPGPEAPATPAAEPRSPWPVGPGVPSPWQSTRPAGPP